MSSIYSKMTVLVVEDDVLVRMHGIDIFEEAGFTVIEADNAHEALAILGEGAQVHMLFSDIDMPGSIDGLELARIVHERWPRIHLLVTSGHHRLNDADVPGLGRFVRKPWQTEAIMTGVAGLVRH